MGGTVHDTICAIATPMGEGGIGVVRLSGEKAIEVASGLVRLRVGRSLSTASPRTLCHADILNPTETSNSSERAWSSRTLDEALVVVMPASHSYTGEDVVEIQCHGSPFVLQIVCDAAMRLGARLAEPGEFTKRAFLNGRLDLAQAEAVLDTIRAKTAGSLRIAQEQLRGSLSREIDRIRETLIRLLAHVEAAIDFAEEDIVFIQPEELASEIAQTLKEVDRLVQSSHEGRMFREGASVAIIGRPNVGKSSLLNALLHADRAIVTPVPGTTRDVLEELLNIRGVPMRLLDTAGVRPTDDPVEQEGMRRSRLAMEEADLLLVVLDGSDELTEEDRAILALGRDKKRLIAVNKSDLPSRLGPSALDLLATSQQDGPAHAVVRISARSGAGLAELRDRMRTLVLRADFEPGEGAIITRLRHRAALMRAREAMDHVAGSVEARLTGEFVAMDLRAAIDALGEITGAVTTDDILDRIFREFCVGK